MEEFSNTKINSYLDENTKTAIVVCKRLRVYTIVDFSFIRTFAPSF